MPLQEQVNQVNIEAYIQRALTDPCFICEMLAGNPAYQHHIIYEDEKVVAFLNKYQILYGYTLVVPREHREQVTADFTLQEYLALQKLIYRVAEAVRQVVPTERLYILSLGSQQAHSHVHWHIAPLPPGVPFEQQQFQALMLENGVLDVSPEEMAVLAQWIGGVLKRLLPA